LMPFVAGVRGHPFTADPAVRRLPDPAFEETYRNVLGPTAGQSLGGWFTMLGLADEKWQAEYLDELVKGTSGYYLKGQIVVRGTPGTTVTIDTRSVLVHELTHALDDQHFPFTRAKVLDTRSEVGFGFEAATEGNAQRVGHEWLGRQGRSAGPGGGGRYTDATGLETWAKYDYGEALVRAVLATGGEAAVDRLLDDPPVTSEQVLHPEKYLAHEGARPVDAPPADAPGARPGPPTGELVTRQMLTTAVGDREAATAADGWGGDFSVTWIRPANEGGLTCLRVRYVMDGPDHLDQLAVAFAKWVTKGENRASDRQGDHLDVTTCAKVPPPPEPGRVID
jgi:hypothetical protein